jgi:pimeloyl-ACP methyl ester carboxylesterase
MQLHSTAVPFSVNGRRLVYLESSKSSTPNMILILLSGLTDPGIGGLPYVNTLLEKLLGPHQDLEISVVQPWLSSSLFGYGSSSLQQDVAELTGMIQHLLESHKGRPRVILMGHSTGAQIVVSYMKYGKYCQPGESSVIGGILQGPVSDREYARWKDVDGNLDKWISLSKSMMDQGKAEEYMPRCVDEGAMTAYRYHSLYSR